MIILRQSTAGQVRMLGPFLDETDGRTVESGLTIANTDIRIQKKDATSFVNKNSGGGTYVEDGYYYATFDATDSNTLGPGLIQVDKAGALPVFETMEVVTANEFDSKYSTDYKHVDVIQVGGTAQTANDMSGDINTILARIIGTLAAGTHSPQSGDAYARLGAPAGASVSADILAIDNFVDDLESRLTAARAGYLDNLNVGGNVASAADIAGLNDPTVAAIADGVWDEDIEAAHGGDAAAGLLLRVLGAAISNRTNNPTLNGLLGVPDSAGVDIPEQVWSEGTRAITDKAGFSLAADQSGVTIGTINAIAANAITAAAIATGAIDADAIAADAIGASEFAQAAADKVWSTAARALTDKADFVLSAASRAAVADDIWDEVIETAHEADGSAGEHLNALAKGILARTNNQNLNALLGVVDASGRDVPGQVWLETEDLTGDTHSYKRILARVYAFLFHKMNITDSSGAVALRNTSDTGDVMTNSITDNDTTTVRTEGSWTGF